MASQKLPLMGHRDHKEEGEVVSEDDWTSSEVRGKRYKSDKSSRKRDKKLPARGSHTAN